MAMNVFSFDLVPLRTPMHIIKCTHLHIMQVPANLEHRSLWRLPKSGIVTAKRAR